MFYNAFLMIFRVAEAPKVDFLVPEPTFSTSENDVDFYIDFGPNKSLKSFQNGGQNAPASLTHIRPRTRMSPK